MNWNVHKLPFSSVVIVCLQSIHWPSVESIACLLGRMAISFVKARFHYLLFDSVGAGD